MIFLILDTSTHNMSLSLYKDNLTCTINHLQNRHEEEILDYIHTFVRNKQLESLEELDYICCGIGPGSFTGTRIACAVAQALISVFKMKAITFSSMYAIAATIHDRVHKDMYTVVKKADINNMYYGVYDINNFLTIEEGIISNFCIKDKIKGYVISDIEFINDVYVDEPCELNVYFMHDYIKYLVNKNTYSFLIHPIHYN